MPHSALWRSLRHTTRPDGTAYELAQLHFHAPSEDTVDGRRPARPVQDLDDRSLVLDRE